MHSVVSGFSRLMLTFMWLCLTKCQRVSYGLMSMYRSTCFRPHLKSIQLLPGLSNFQGGGGGGGSHIVRSGISPE